MAEFDLEALNRQYAIPGHVSWMQGVGGLVTAEVNNGLARGAITLAGGHVTSFCKKNGGLENQPDVLWMSPNSAHTIGKAMRGGIPICWPWFANQSADPKTLPMHGFARISLWSPAGTRALADGSTEVRMILHDSQATRALWPHAFELEATAVFGRDLHLTLTVRNPGPEPFEYTCALHTYFNVSNTSQILIHGFEGVEYLDKPDNYALKQQHQAVRIEGETDRIYLDTTADCVVEDPGFGRKIRIAKKGSHTSVVWNPAQKAALYPDVGEGNQVHFVCVETTNAAQDIIHVPAGGETQLVAQISLE